jgi:hypothetical protein
MVFKGELVRELKGLVPNLPFDLVYPNEQGGYIRFNKDKLDSIYLESLKDNLGNNIILKFVVNKDSKWEFSDIYVCADNCNEFRFDKDLNFNARYLKGISIPAELDEDMKLHLLDVLNEWQKMSKVLGEHDYISEYQVQKEGSLVKKAYAVFAKKLKPQPYSEVSNMVNDFNIKEVEYFQKIEIKNKEVTKKNDLYLIIQNKYE